MTSILKAEIEAIKAKIGNVAASFVKEGMLVGLGTGSTSTCFIEALGKRCREGLQIRTVSSSQRSLKLAESRGIPTIDINTIDQIDLTIDGADEIDPEKRMIKGGGGALLREKILATSSKEMIVIVDESKLVKQLGAFGLPVEIIPFAFLTTEYKLKELGYQGDWRKKENGDLYVTDNGNYLLDIAFPRLCQNPQEEHLKIRSVTGVVETGFFIDLAHKVIVGYLNGQVSIYEELPS